MSKEKSRLAFGVPKADFMKISSFNFIENEKMCNTVLHADGCDNVSSRELSAQNNPIKTNSPLKKSTSQSRTNSEKIEEDNLLSIETSEEIGNNDYRAPKRYVTKCFFQPKQEPVSYSETVILTLGSNKKRYYETVMYQTKLYPFRWIESLLTLTPASKESMFKANHSILIEEPKYHYMSLEPQQADAMTKLQKDVSA